MVHCQVKVEQRLGNTARWDGVCAYRVYVFGARVHESTGRPHVETGFLRQADAKWQFTRRPGRAVKVHLGSVEPSQLHTPLTTFGASLHPCRPLQAGPGPAPPHAAARAQDDALPQGLRAPVGAERGRRPGVHHRQAGARQQGVTRRAARRPAFFHGGRLVLLESIQGVTRRGLSPAPQELRPSLLEPLGWYATHGLFQDNPRLPCCLPVSALVLRCLVSFILSAWLACVVACEAFWEPAPRCRAAGRLLYARVPLGRMDCLVVLPQPVGTHGL